jgi:prephenate dehydrogenase
LNTVAIFGVGLIGGSFALALRHAGFHGSIIGVSSPSTIERALALPSGLNLFGATYSGDTKLSYSA